MDNRGPLTDAADDERAIDAIDEFGEIRIDSGILAHDGVFDAGDNAFVDQPGNVRGSQEILGLHIDDDGPRKFLGEGADGARTAVRCRGKRLRQHHRRWKCASAQHARLIDKLAKVGARGWDDPCAGRRGRFQEIEQRAVFVQADVVEVGVAAIHQRRYASRFEMADQCAIGVMVERQVGAPRKGRHAQDRTRNVRRSDVAGFHEHPPDPVLVFAGACRFCGNYTEASGNLCMRAASLAAAPACPAAGHCVTHP